MTIVEYRKVKCDECGKEEIIKNSGSYPSYRLVIDISEWFGSTGEIRLNKEVCSEECALKLMKKLKEIPKHKVCIY